MNNACPECGAVYAVTENDIGRRIACKKCNARLVVAEEGLVKEDAAAAPPRKEDTGERERDRPRRRDDEEREERGSRRKRDRDDDAGDAADAVRKIRGPGMGEYLNKMKGVADLPTWLYGIGLFLTIYGFFSVGLDRATTAGRQGKYESERLDWEVYKRGVNDKPDGKAPSADESKRLDEKEKEWNKSTEPGLMDSVKFAAASEKKAVWYNVMFKMIGFFLLAFGAIGFLKPDESPLKRILGGATILLILLQVIGGGVGINLQMGGGGGAGG